MRGNDEQQFCVGTGSSIAGFFCLAVISGSPVASSDPISDFATLDVKLPVYRLRSSRRKPQRCNHGTEGVRRNRHCTKYIPSRACRKDW